jgi:Uncharacterized Fe-S protein
MTIAQEQLKEYITSLGASFVGYSYLYDKLPEYLKEFPYVITFGVRLSNAIINEIDDKPTFNYFNHYRSLNALIDQIGLRTSLFLQDNGYMAYTIGASQSIPNAPQPYSGIFPHKTGAVVSGLGWIGKNGLFIHNEFGPRVRLGTILTNMELPYTNQITDSKCGSCNRCVKVCPAAALTGNEWTIGCSREDVVNAQACSEFMNKNFKHIGRGSVCGLCIKTCPVKK